MLEGQKGAVRERDPSVVAAYAAGSEAFLARIPGGSAFTLSFRLLSEFPTKARQAQLKAAMANSRGVPSNFARLRVIGAITKRLGRE
jgi:hypothetical protein